jgi:hypothetical protein
LQAKRDAVVLMSVSVPRRGAARGYPVRSCWPRRRGSPVCRPLDLDNNADPARARGNMCGCWVSRRRRSGRQPVGGTIRVWKTTDQRNTSCMMPSRATRGKAETSVSSVSHAGRAQINPICAAAPINRSPLARLQNGGSARGYQRAFALQQSRLRLRMRAARPYIYATPRLAPTPASAAM